jgi:hypothetical protein
MYNKILSPDFAENSKETGKKKEEVTCLFLERSQGFSENKK